MRRMSVSPLLYLMSFFLSLEAFAQVAPSPSDGVHSEQIDEIVVTAQKREERLQDVGLTVSAFGAKTLADQRVNSVADLAKIVPGLDVTQSPDGPPVYTLRGVGFFESSVAAYPDVATYIDQAPLALPVFSVLTAFDLERIEVLKGPQGTLFGNNATGGAINFVAAKPTSTLDAGFDLGYGRFNTVQTDGFVSGPLSDTLNARLSVKTTRGDDWQYSYTRNDTAGKTDNSAVRLQLEWQPQDRFAVLWNINGWQDRSDAQVPQLARESTPADLQAPVGTVGATGAITPAFYILHYPLPPQNDRAADWAPSVAPRQDNNFFQTTLNGTYKLSDDITLTSLTGYVAYHMNKADPLSGLDQEALEFSSDIADASDLSQEIRLANTNGSDQFHWVAGANWNRTNVDEVADQVFPYASTGFEQGFSAAQTYTDQHTRNVAGFGNVSFDVSSVFTLKGGARYTDSRHSDIAGTTDLPGYVEPFGGIGITDTINYLFTNIYNPIFCPGVAYDPIKNGQSITINPKTCQSGTYQDVLREHNTAWSTGFDYKPIENVLLYVNVSKGFKGGAFPLSAAASQVQYLPVKQESLLDYETGFKTSALGGRVVVDGALFYYDYTNKQLRSAVVDPFFGALNNLVNIPKSSEKGAETDITYRPVHGLSMRLAATYLDSQITAYNGIIGSDSRDGLLYPIYGNFKGVPLPFAPKFQGTASVDYEFPITERMNVFAGATDSAQAKSYGSPQLLTQSQNDVEIKAYSTLDLRAGVGAPDGKWRVTLWGTNVLNEYYWTNSLRNFDTYVRYTGRPAEFGVTFAWRL